MLSNVFRDEQALAGYATGRRQRFEAKGWAVLSEPPAPQRLASRARPALPARPDAERSLLEGGACWKRHPATNPARAAMPMTHTGLIVVVATTRAPRVISTAKPKVGAAAGASRSPVNIIRPHDAIPTPAQAA